MHNKKREMIKLCSQQSLLPHNSNKIMRLKYIVKLIKEGNAEQDART
jgi:hypothetical protein